MEVETGLLEGKVQVGEQTSRRRLLSGDDILVGDVEDPIRQDAVPMGHEAPVADIEIRELIQLGEAGISFDAPLKADTKTTYQEVLADPRAANPEHDAEINSVELMAHELLNELPKREKDVLKGLFGIDHETPQTLREVGESLQISHERVRQLRDQALRRIKKARNREVLREKYEAYIAALS